MSSSGRRKTRDEGKLELTIFSFLLPVQAVSSVAFFLSTFSAPFQRPPAPLPSPSAPERTADLPSFVPPTSALLTSSRLASSPPPSLRLSSSFAQASPTLYPPLDYNVSYDGDWVVMAWTRGLNSAVGVDVMRLGLPKGMSDANELVEALEDQVRLRLFLSSSFPPQAQIRSLSIDLISLLSLFGFAAALSLRTTSPLLLSSSRSHDAPPSTLDAQGINRKTSRNRIIRGLLDLLVRSSSFPSRRLKRTGRARSCSFNGRARRWSEFERD